MPFSTNTQSEKKRYIVYNMTMFWGLIVAMILSVVMLGEYYTCSGDVSVDHDMCHIAWHEEYSHLHIDIVGMMQILLFGVSIITIAVAGYFKAKHHRTKRIEAFNLVKGKDEAVEVMNHELRTPLNGIIGMSSVLSKQLEPGTELHHNIKTIEMCGHHMLLIINNILTNSILKHNGYLTPSYSDVHMPSFLGDITDMLSGLRSSKYKNVSIDYRCTPFDAVIKTDPTLLRQVLLNLAGNAVKFTEQGSVTITYSQDMSKNSCTIQVKDTGSGIADDDLPTIFGADVKIANRSNGGTGLGLYITKRIITELSGNMLVSSKLGEGTSVIITLPIR